MKHFSINHVVKASLIVLLIAFMTVPSFAALNAYLKLKGHKGAKTYTCKLDNDGKFSFDNVEPGTYDLIFVLDGSRSTDDGTLVKIEVSSFSWGATNTSASARITKSRSNIQNNRTATVDAAPPSVTSDGKAIATGDLDGDGAPDAISAPVAVSLSNLAIEGKGQEKVVLKDVIVSSVCAPKGTVKGSWNLKENVK